eukprot:126123_1
MAHMWFCWLTFYTIWFATSIGRSAETHATSHEVQLKWLASDVLKVETNNFTYQYFHLDENLLGKKIFISHTFLNIDFIKHTLSDLVTNHQYTVENVDNDDFFIVFSPKYPRDCHIKLLINHQDFVCDMDQIDGLLNDSSALTAENVNVLFNIFRLMYHEIRQANIINNKLNHQYKIFDINKEFPFELINKTEVDTKNVFGLKQSVYFDIESKIPALSMDRINKFKNANSIISEKLQKIGSMGDVMIQTDSVVKLRRYKYLDHIAINVTNENVKVEGRLVIKNKFVQNSSSQGSIEINIPLLLKQFDKDYIFTFPFYIEEQTQIGFMHVKRDSQFYGAIMFEINIKQVESKCMLFLNPITYIAQYREELVFPIVNGESDGGHGAIGSHGAFHFDPHPENPERDPKKVIMNKVFCFLFQCEEMLHIGDLYLSIKSKQPREQPISVKQFTYIELDFVFHK